MGFLREIFEDMDVLRSLGEQARAEARAAGANSYYIDPKFPEVILVEYPDGRVEAKDESSQSKRHLSAG